ncbi:hypothetical protein GCM10010168_05090 [Actinoplanes ianthinogenes]|uniref:Uncharacterized protein n=1 Tax=Actinoplanes ianthinogenes TaxID=122358 RepID=A0ABN6CB26_9ACTN|nr:hypothetical protein Aiant_34070 [Actinoplanes ianthinogenes]GGQ92455.1 hypothetical protein GCM10010168_05090 [Actinoplanes ianthinogenes]
MLTLTAEVTGAGSAAGQAGESRSSRTRVASRRPFFLLSVPATTTDTPSAGQVSEGCNARPAVRIPPPSRAAATTRS